jgi:hypothetical protein
LPVAVALVTTLRPEPRMLVVARADTAPELVWSFEMTI